MLGADRRADHRAVTARAALLWALLPPLLSPLLSTGALSLGMLAANAPGAAAVEWIVGGSVSQRLGVDSNPELEEEGDPSLRATTALGIDITALTPTTQWQIETGASGTVGVGGGDDADELNSINPNFAAAVAHDGKHVDTGASFAFDMQPSSFAQFEETGVTDGDATQMSVQLAADAAYALDARNRLSVGGFGRIIRFTGGTTTLVPTTSYGTNLAWIRALGPATDGSLTFGLRRFSSESSENPESLTFSLAAGAGHAVNRRLSVDGSLGLTATRTTRIRFGDRETEFTVGGLGDLAVIWAPEADTQFVLALSHGLEPSSLGELQTTTALGLSVDHSINSWISGGVSALVQQQSSGDGFEEEEEEGEEDTRTLASISPSLAFSLAPDWALRASYALALEREGGSDAISNQVFVTLTHQFDILP
jgi:hypothetical protein